MPTFCPAIRTSASSVRDLGTSCGGQSSQSGMEQVLLRDSAASPQRLPLVVFLPRPVRVLLRRQAITPPARFLHPILRPRSAADHEAPDPPAYAGSRAPRGFA
ncbi:hypothetical protein GUJ93_ZPchr0012g20216 [Zizania palustris]|uniref:Uncharacterized protein n=1 Tax=Zizania palustris TaxID=103762 RepID=A0A8J5WR25_ZIZPA|nr:hypothetical protein GUJ93_ZPchr0012g20216 [Zizania palustris]